VIVVEHDLALIRRADWILDMGPGAGVKGGTIVAQGRPKEVARTASPTAPWLRGAGSAAARASASEPPGQPRRWLVVEGPRENNLSGKDVRIPIDALCGICGVSGSGKSTLAVDTLGRALAPRKHTTSVAREPLEPGKHDGIRGAPERAVVVDQSRAGMGSVLSFLGLEAAIRRLYARGPDAASRGLSAADLGRGCRACRGSGAVRIEMGFLPDVSSPCEACGGTGYPEEIRQISCRGLSLPRFTSLTVEEARALWADEESVARPLGLCAEAGLGYLVLRQRTLSGGEAQRLKMVGELMKREKPGALYILDEPTVGLHPDDVASLVSLLRRLVASGHGALVVEHDPQFLASCDWLIEMGPGGGPAGGRVIAQGTPRRVARGNTPTAPYLREMLP
jgi:excinuclease ABC subunit A